MIHFSYEFDQNIKARGPHAVTGTLLTLGAVY